jgi:hypothetical protein
MNRPLHFLYSIQNYGGRCYGVSVAQALDRAKVDFIRAFLGVDPKSPKFRVEKSKLKEVSVRLELAPVHYARHAWLYRTFKDGELTQVEVAELETLRTIINDPRLHKEKP